MNLYSAPKTTTLKDGSIIINIQAITPEYIENHIKNIEAVEKMDIEEVIRVIRGSNNLEEANNSLVSRFNITHQVADFILNMELSEVSEYVGNEAFCKSEIEKWDALLEVIG
jgi:DNA gyrase/topoisomerase IV subunit A